LIGGAIVILIWGFKALFKTIGSGTFFCPNEGGDRGYQLKQARKWFTFFWIPIIPLKVLGEQIECGSCGAAYDPRVLELPTTSHIQDRLTSALRLVVVAMLRVDDVIEPEEKTRAIEIAKRLGHDDYDLELLNRDLVELKVGDLDEELVAVAQMLTTQGQEAVIEACLALAAADGHIDDSELDVIIDAGRSLGMSPAHIRGVVAGITEEAES